MRVCGFVGATDYKTEREWESNCTKLQANCLRKLTGPTNQKIVKWGDKFMGFGGKANRPSIFGVKQIVDVFLEYKTWKHW